MLVILVYYAKIVHLGSSVNKIGKFIGLSHIKRQVYRAKITNFAHEKSNKMIKDIVFDFGGVLTLLDTEKALQCFRNIGIEKPEDYINAYLQNGPFFSLENGDITADKFCEELSAIAGRTITHEQAKEAWLGFIVKVQTEFLDYLQLLRPRYRLSVLSNTNPFIQSWARSKEFTPGGKSLDDYFDMLFLSYKMNASKPSEEIYRKMLLQGNMKAEETLFVDDGTKNIETARKMGINVLKVANGEDWREILEKTLACYR